jgi:hypothetical protein
MALYKTAKALGINKGDFVQTDSGFVGIVIGGANTYCPLCEVWGIYQELGSTYAEQLTKISKEEFLQSEWYKRSPGAKSSEAKKALGVK